MLIRLIHFLCEWSGMNYKCDICGAEFYTLVQLLDHVRDEHGIK